jgi:hypothetical protein
MVGEAGLSEFEDLDICVRFRDREAYPEGWAGARVSVSGLLR